MKPKDLRTGLKLELELYDENGDVIRPALVSQFESIDAEEVIEILTPIREGVLYPVHKGDKMGVIYEKDGDLFSFTAVMLERKREGNVHLLRIKALTEIQRIQRRSFFRFDTVQDVSYRLFESVLLEDEERGPFKKSITKDISGGGVCILMEDKPSMGNLIEGELQLSGDVKFMGKVVRVIAMRESGRFKYEIGVMFTKIDNRSRERIISFIFETQRNLLKKGWSPK